jgi:hypothetical protein
MSSLHHALYASAAGDTVKVADHNEFIYNSLLTQRNIEYRSTPCERRQVLGNDAWQDNRAIESWKSLVQSLEHLSHEISCKLAEILQKQLKLGALCQLLDYTYGIIDD